MIRRAVFAGWGRGRFGRGRSWSVLVDVAHRNGEEPDCFQNRAVLNRAFPLPLGTAPEQTLEDASQPALGSAILAAIEKQVEVAQHHGGAVAKH